MWPSFFGGGHPYIWRNTIRHDMAIAGKYPISHPGNGWKSVWPVFDSSVHPPDDLSSMGVVLPDRLLSANSVVKAVSDTTSLHVSVSVLGEAMVWQARRFKARLHWADKRDNHYQRCMKSMAAWYALSNGYGKLHWNPVTEEFKAVRLLISHALSTIIHQIRHQIMAKRIIQPLTIF